MNDKILSFEDSFHRLEQILEKMNSGSVSLDESIHLYEEADRLISHCTKKLQEAEKTIEVLQKNRAGDVVMGTDHKPQTQPFQP